MGFPPSAGLVLKDKGHTNDAASGDTAIAEILSSTGSNVVFLPEVAVTTPSKGSTKTIVDKRVPRAAPRRGYDRNKVLTSICLVLLSFSVTIMIVTTTVETMKYADLLPNIKSYKTFFYPKVVPVVSKSGYHIHRDLSGNVFRNTLASGDHCIHRRQFELDHSFDEVIHDTSTGWSAIVERNHSRCLLFYMKNEYDEHNACPVRYPWQLDEMMGVMTARTSLKHSSRRTSSRIVTRLFSSSPAGDISCTGAPISHACDGMDAFEVMAVTMCCCVSEASTRVERSAMSHGGEAEDDKSFENRPREITTYAEKDEPQLETESKGMSLERKTISKLDKVLSESSIGPMTVGELETARQMLDRLLMENF